MDEIESIDIRELVYSECKSLEIAAKKNADASITGAYRSLKRGTGIEFEETRLYTPSDDARRIDWKVTARKQKAYIKSFREERDQSIFLIVDGSLSTLLGVDNSKSQKILETAAFIGSIATFNRDAIGSILFNEDGFSYNKPKKGFASVFKILNEVLSIRANPKLVNLIKFNSDDKIDFSLALQNASRLIKRKSQIFIISDFNFPANFDSPLRSLSIKHDLFCISVADKLESKLPEKGTFLLKNPENGSEVVLDFSDKKTRSALLDSITRHRHAISQTIKRQKIPLLELTSDSDIRSNLFTFFREQLQVHGRS